MSNYHTNSLKKADIFTVMGSICAEVARYDSAISAGQKEQARHAVDRAKELIGFAQGLSQINTAQTREIEQFSAVFLDRAKGYKKSGLHDYLLPYAVSARMRQFS